MNLKEFDPGTAGLMLNGGKITAFIKDTCGHPFIDGHGPGAIGGKFTQQIAEQLVGNHIAAADKMSQRDFFHFSPYLFI
jgi:hypothetical protein